MYSTVQYCSIYVEYCRDLDVGKEMRYNGELSGNSKTVRIHKNYHRMHQNFQDAAELSGYTRTVRMQQNCQDAPKLSGCSRTVRM
jgi:hypothetical protein